MVIVAFTDCGDSFVAAHLFPFLCLFSALTLPSTMLMSQVSCWAPSQLQLERLKCSVQSYTFPVPCWAFQHVLFTVLNAFYIINIHLHKHSLGRLEMLHLWINLRLFINRWKMFSCRNGSAEQCASSEFYIAKICWAGIELNSSIFQISLTFQLYIKVKHIISKMQC